MAKSYLKLILFTLHVLLAIPAAHAEQYFICKAPSTGMAGKGGCVHAYFPSENEVCSGKGGQKVCSTKSLEDLCIKVGKQVGIALNQFASGLGHFESESVCLEQCHKEYGGKLKQFGGKCFGTLIK